MKLYGLAEKSLVMQIMSDMNVRKKWMTRCFPGGELGLGG